MLLVPFARSLDGETLDQTVQAVAAILDVTEEETRRLV